MAISALGPISNVTAFIQPPPAEIGRLDATQAFARVLEASVSGPPVRVEALAGAVPPQHFVDVLEQALLRDLVRQLERSDLSGFTPALERVLASDAGLPLPLSAQAIAPLFDAAASAERLAFAAGVATLFNTIQLLDNDPGAEPRVGALLDIFA